MKQVLLGLLAIISVLLIILVIGHRRIENGGQIEDAITAYEITAQQVNNHKTASDCWSAIGGSVYDLTNYFYKNPDDFLANSLCGKITQEANLPDTLNTQTLITYKIGILIP
jgi:hypothetical protein